MVMLIVGVVPGLLIGSAVTLSHPVTIVGVALGVGVIVSVGVGVALGSIVSEGKGVNVG